MQTTDPSNLWRTETDLVLENARREKSEKTKNLGSPINLPGKPLSIIVDKNDCWIAESNAVVRKVNLETGKTVQIFKGHMGPVTCIELYKSALGDSKASIVISGSWDRTIRLWSTKDGTLLGTTEAHSDFVKALLVVPELKLLVSSGSDKVVRFWDLTNPSTSSALPLLGVISAHSRPVQCLSVDIKNESNMTLYTADTMGVIMVWNIERQYSEASLCRATELRQLNDHRTGVNDMCYHKQSLWTASTDETVRFLHDPPLFAKARAAPPISHPAAVRAILPLSCSEVDEPYLITAAADIIRVYDVSSVEDPELVQEIDAHWHDVISLRLWIKSFRANDGRLMVEPWVVSASLDGTLRRWKLGELLNPVKKEVTLPSHTNEMIANSKSTSASRITEEEERELADLMDSN